MWLFAVFWYLCHGRHLARNHGASSPALVRQELKGLELDKAAANSSASLREAYHEIGKVRQHKMETYVSADSSIEEVSLNHIEDGKVRLPWEAKPLVSCNLVDRKPGSKEEQNLRDAVQQFCHLDVGSLVEFYIDNNFVMNDKKFRDDKGWIDEAYISYMGIRDPEANIGVEVDLLLQSLHNFSTRPVVVANFGHLVPTSWTPERYPKLLLMHAKPLRDNSLFNFNKIRAMMFTKVRNGMVVDADQFLSPGADALFARTAEEITSDYPYPIMPVHWMSRDPEGDCGYHVYDFNFKNESAPRRTMRWGHAHPTFTHYALPFLAKWSLYVIEPERSKAPRWLVEQGHLEDEDLLNVALWATGATKQWCKFDIPAPSVYKLFVDQLDKRIHYGNQYPDSKWFPKGVALVFYTAHAAKKPEESFQWLSTLWKGVGLRKHILYNGSWFESGAELRKYDPDLKCMI